MNKNICIVVCVIGCGLLSACGQKGALYLPQQTINQAQRVPTQISLYQNQATTDTNDFKRIAK